MTLRDLIALAERERDEADAVLFTLREVADMTGTPHKTVRRWRETGALPVVLWGPHRKPRVEASVILRMFCQHRLTPSPTRPVRLMPSPYRVCGTIRPSA